MLGKFGAREQMGYTPLMCAAREGHTDCVRLLLDAGADKEAQDYVRASRSAAWVLLRVWIVVMKCVVRNDAICIQFHVSFPILLIFSDFVFSCDESSHRDVDC